MASASRYPPRSAAFYRQQQVTQDYFDYYRTVGDDNWDAEARREVINARLQPTQNYQGLGLAEQGFQTAWHRSPFLLGAQDCAVSDEAKLFTRDALNAESFRKQLQEAGIRFVKILGWGSNGLVSLWHVLSSRADASTGIARFVSDNVVLKNHYSTPESISSLKNERRILSILARSPHIVHRVYHASRISNARGPIDDAATTAAAAAELDADDSFLWTELLKHKDLDSLLRKVGSANERFPVPVLWRIFQCLVDAVTAMAYPPRFQTSPPHPEIGPDIIETIPPQRHAGGDGYHNIVHFDLDPQNIFLSDVDTGHAQFQRLQFGDLGHAKTSSDFGISPGIYNNYGALWGSRMLGKAGYYTPEQMTAEWDQVEYEPFSEGITSISTGKGTAAAYSELSNVWSIGLLMWCCMTLCEPRRPPTPGQGTGLSVQGWTYGSELRDAGYMDRFGEPLCHLVAQCLMHYPSDRPSLSALREAVVTGITNNPITAHDQQWIRNRGLGPPSPARLPTYPMGPTEESGARVPIFDDEFSSGESSGYSDDEYDDYGDSYEYAQ